MRWNKVESIFHEALSLHGEQRARFLDEACQGDESIRSEVDSLLASHHESDEFLEEGALPQSAQISGPTFNNGVLLGHYEIIQLLGAGGMGEVYLARDQRLGRKVALKILPAGFAGSIERLRREAQAASALNHPNILTIYDFGQQSELHYIVSEFVDGVQLREKIGSLSMAEALNYARQIGQALEAAHSVGIVHRDIKPENIMVRPDGYIKVLDFGLAKLITPQSASGQSLYQRLAGSGAATVPGMLLGTLNYMSPEQVRGQLVDLRTDIWSWGVVLYEMISGSRPFEAPTPGDVLAAILNKEPLPPSDNQEFNRVVARALSKQAEQRYHNMPEALRDLASISGGHVTQQRPLPAPLAATSRPVASSPQSSSRWRSRRWKMGVVLLALLVLVGLGVLLDHRMRNAGNQPLGIRAGSQPFGIKKLIPVTTGGNVQQSAISPDGKYVAYATVEAGGTRLRVRKIDSGSEVEIVPDTADPCSGITFSPDGQFIFYVLKGNRDGSGSLYKVPARGGPSILVHLDVDSAVSFSPDGTQYAFLRVLPSDSHAALVLAFMEQGQERVLATLNPPDYFAVTSPPAWSPDGRAILCVRWNDRIPDSVQFMSVRVSDNSQEVVSVPWSSISGPVWLKDGRGVVVLADESNKRRPRLMQVFWREGVISPIFHEAARIYKGLEATSDSRIFSTIQTALQSSVWVVPLSHRGGGQRVRSRERFDGITWTESGKIVSPSRIEGGTDSGSDLWFMDSKSHQQYSVIDKEFIERDPVASRDGKYLVYTSTRGGGVHLFRSGQDGSNVVRLTSTITSVEGDPAITPDSKWVIHTSIAGGSEALWKVPMSGGEATPVTKDRARKPSISPHGDWIACEYSADPSQGWSITLLESATGRPVRSFPEIPAGNDQAPVRWSADGKSLLYVVTDTNGVSNIWKQPVDGGIRRQLTHFKEERIFAFAPSPDGSSLACIRGKQVSNVVLLETGK
jgi:serine/threonine protein kinase